ncbi:porin family protein [Endozoicomonas sp. Mp262]|uniref:outer membrane protein n=1 Tax=Endozoicomonas sp. Mp262 TaxID=2919499 RepID=UPI0021D847C6
MRTGIFALLLGLALNAQGREGHSGFYGGVLGGGGKFTGKVDYSTLNLEVGDNVSGYGLFLGYKTTKGNMTAGFEVDYLEYSGNIDLGVQATNYHLKAKMKHFYSASLLLGYMTADTVEVYLRGGYGKTHATIEVGEVTPIESDISFKMPVAGIGVRFSNDTSLGLKLEYRYHFNEDYKMSDNADFKSSANLFLVNLDYMY